MRHKRSGRLLVAVCATAALLIGGAAAADVASPHNRIAPNKAKSAKLAKVNGLSVTDVQTVGTSHARVSVDWKGVDGATDYRVRWSDNLAMRKSQRSSTTKSKATVTGLSTAKRVCLAVRGIDKSGKRTRRGPESDAVCLRTPKGVGRTSQAWVTRQQLVGTLAGPRVSLTLKWPRAKRASEYDLVLKRDGSQSVQHAVGTSSSRQTTTISGLLPDATYCLAVRGRSATGVGQGTKRNCKRTIPAQTTTSLSGTDDVAVKMATYNVCSKQRNCQKRWSWDKRVGLVADRIDSAKADVVAIQETSKRLKSLMDRLRPLGWRNACDYTGLEDQAILIRDASYGIDLLTRDAVRFPDDFRHGACWARLRHRATGTRVVVASLHLKVGGTRHAVRVRRAQTASVIEAMERRFGQTSSSRTPPFVLAGDFNSALSNRRDSPATALAEHELVDSFDVSTTYDRPFLDSGRGWSEVPRKSANGRHIDRIFVPSGLAVTGWKSVTDLRKGRYVTPMPSDHNMIAVTVFVKKTGGILGLPLRSR